MSQDILGHNKMPWTWDCLDIHQLTGMSGDIPGYPSWDYIPLVRMSQNDPGHPRTQYHALDVGLLGYTAVDLDVLGYPWMS